MPLKICIVGAGIAGLSAAITLRDAGHTVKILEKSKFASEVGAAIAVAPNGAVVLSRLGIDQSRTRPTVLQVWDTRSGIDLSLLNSVDVSQRPMHAYHRIDLHSELLRKAVGDDPTILQLDSKVVKVDAENGTVELENGDQHLADLIIAGDGLHSVVRAAVINTPDPLLTGLNSLRFLVPTERVLADAELQKIWETKKDYASGFFDTRDLSSHRHFVWYGCRNGEIQNFNAIHPAREVDEEGWAESDFKEILKEEFAAFHPTLQRLFPMGDHVKGWRLCSRNPLSTYTYGRVLLIGDAAHPMFPIGGQGANQSLEDGGAIGYMLRDVDTHEELRKRLLLYEKVRVNRSARCQILSNAPSNREMEVSDKFREWLDDPDDLVPQSMKERIQHDQEYNVYQRCDEILRASGYA